MSTGMIAFIGIWVLAAVLVVWNMQVRRGHARRLQALGFKRAVGDAPAQAFTTVAAAHGTAKPRIYGFGNSYTRSWGSAAVHFLSVVDKTNADTGRDRNTTGGAFDAFVAELDTHDLVHRRVSVYLAPKGPRFLRGFLEKLIKLDPPGEQLVIDGPARDGSILAAFGDRAGSLNDYLPSQTRERLVRAAGAGFLTAHLAPGRIALVVGPASRDLEAQWTHLRSWL